MSSYYLSKRLPGQKIDKIYDCPVDISIYYLLIPLVPILHKLKITPNMITYFSMTTHFLSIIGILYNRFWIINYFLWSIAYIGDIADGVLARRFKMISAYGDFLDHTNDTLFSLGLGYIFYILLNNCHWKVFFFYGVYFVLFLNNIRLSELLIGYNQKKNKFEPSQFLTWLDIVTYSPDNEDSVKDLLKITRFAGPGCFNLASMFLIYYWPQYC